AHRHDERHLRPGLAARRRVAPAAGEARRASLQHVDHHRWSQVKLPCSARAVRTLATGAVVARAVTPGADHAPVVLPRQARGLGAGAGPRGRAAPSRLDMPVVVVVSARETSSRRDTAASTWWMLLSIWPRIWL